MTKKYYESHFGKLKNLEPKIQINGIELTIGQAMAVRVAVTNYRYDLADPVHSKDMGAIGQAYDARLSEVEQIMMKDVS